jgi:hypothetical protein
VEAKFSAPVQTESEAPVASFTTGTGSFQGVKRPGCGIDHPPPYGAEVKERVELYVYTIWAFMTYSRLNFTFLLSLPTFLSHKQKDSHRHHVIDYYLLNNVLSIHFFQTVCRVEFLLCR